MSSIREGEREEKEIGWLKEAPKVKWVREEGRDEIDWLKESPRVRWVINKEGEREDKGWRNKEGS